MGGKVLLLGRVVFSFFFIYSGFNHLTKLSMYAQYAGASGVPAPTLLTAISGLMLLAGGLSILLGVQVRWGALLIAIFLVTAAFTVHKFWGIADPGGEQAVGRAGADWDSDPHPLLAARSGRSRSQISASGRRYRSCRADAA